MPETQLELSLAVLGIVICSVSMRLGGKKQSMFEVLAADIFLARAPEGAVLDCPSFDFRTCRLCAAVAVVKVGPVLPRQDVELFYIHPAIFGMAAGAVTCTD